MHGSLLPRKLEKLVVSDRRLVFTLLSYVSVLAFSTNLITVKLWVIGLVAFTTYFSINGMFLSRVFFEKETLFFRLAFGVLLLIMLLGFVGWLVMIIYDLDVAEFSLVLLIVATFSSLINNRMNKGHAC